MDQLLPWKKPIAIFYWSRYSEVIYVLGNSRHCVIFLGDRTVIFLRIINLSGAWCGVVVKALR
jgi:hypothetical protein